MDLRATEPGQSQEPRLGTAKYLYPSGSRPLAGYVIKRGVGRGGFGEVYFATSDAGKEVALKLVRRNLDVELRGVVQCLNLRHPNLVALYDIRQDDDQDTWVIMEYVGGRTLDRVIADCPQGMPPAEAMRWLQGIAAGVAYLHDHGIVHRDLKPGNVFCDEGLVKLGDYGLSKFISASRRSGQTESVGTVHYMAPEVANGRYGKEIDIYAMGVVFYEMLTGRVPFEGESVGEVLMKHLTAQPDLSSLAEPYRGVVARALDKDPDRRFGTVGEFLAALGASTAADDAPVGDVASPKGVAYSSVATVGAVPLATAASPALESPVQPLLSAGASPQAFDLYTDDEPIWRWVRTNWLELRTAWKKADLHPVVRVAIMVVALFAFLSTSGFWLPAALFYGIYRIVRAIMNTGKPPANYVRRMPPPLPQRGAPGEPPSQPAVVAAQPRIQPIMQPVASFEYPAGVSSESSVGRLSDCHGRADACEPSACRASAREQFTELLKSMLASALVVGVICVLATPLFDRPLHATQYLWLAMVATVGSWAVMIPAKFWEGRSGDEVQRRFAMLVVGLLLGSFAWGIERMLVVELPYSTNSAVREATTWAEKALPGEVTSVVFDHRGAPTVEGFLAYFAFLFPVLRWWTLADPSRRSRVGLWRTAAYGLWAFVLCQFWSFPEQFAVVTAVSMALAVQLSSPWTDSLSHSSRRAA